MKIGLKSLDFILPDKPLDSYSNKLDSLTEDLKSIAKKAGGGSNKFKSAYEDVCSAIYNGRNLAEILDSPIKVRALAVSLLSNLSEDIHLTPDIFREINKLRPNPSSLLIQNMYQYYLKWYDQLANPTEVARWLKDAMDAKGLLKDYHKELLSQNGPKWIAEQCITNTREFSNQLTYLGLENYAAGRFLTVAKSIYYVEQLKTIPVNQPHPLLLELQNRSAFESRYDEHFLLGHKVLQILIKRAPQTEINDSWLNVIMNIAGDPRVPKTHPKYQKWWSAIEPTLQDKVRGWVSSFSLRVFLEALENYSAQPRNDGLKRMFPARKVFLEGLLNKGLITNVKLYLTQGFASYLRQNYKQEHLPNFLRVTTGSISVIYIQLGETHMIEGSHSCQLWIYKALNPTAIVFDDTKVGATYSALTSGLNSKMYGKNNEPLLVDNVVHHPPLNWQNKAINALNKSGIDITARDVLSINDYQQYKRRYGVI